MSENPVRSASAEAAKEMWVLKNTSSVPSEIQSQMADIIESKFARVVAAAEEAMKEKCAKVLCSRCAKNIPVEHLDISCNGAWMWIHREREPGWPEFNRCDADKIRAIPTGTALAEYTEDAAGQALARMFYLIEHPDEIVPVSETSYYTNDYAIAFREIIERAKAGWRAEMQPKLDYLNNGWRERDEYIASLKAQQAEAERKAYLKVRQALEGAGDAPIPEGVCSNEDQEEGFSDGVCCTLNLIWKAIASLEKSAALSAPAKEGEK